MSLDNVNLLPPNIRQEMINFQSIKAMRDEITMWRTMYFNLHALSHPEYFEKLEYFLNIPSVHFMADKPDNQLERVLMRVKDD